MSEKPKKFEKKNVLFLVIAGLLIIIIIMSFYIHALRNRSTTTIVTAPTKTSSSVSSASSSSTSKYVEGKDYIVKYSNDGILDKASVDEAMTATGVNNYENDMDTDGGNYAKIEIYYNKAENVVVQKLFQNGYKNNEPTVIIAYDLSTKKQVEGYISKSYYDNMPLVYTWTNDTVQ
ncbi:alanyl-tRNA synthetase [Leuconostoc mesenteroides]|uniref:alanyl-tRNA synthetase n=1 Tax=Leuconostoc mesenteroides TaxID=1245 RepID=UPI0009B91954|nr:alanyl-tRNA synthetase [Leuconostoc mesenteroides]